MTKILGVNFAFNHTNDAQKRDTFIDKLQSAYTLGMVDSPNDIKMVNEWAKAHPATQTIGRIFYDQEGGMHLKPTGKGDENKEFTVSPEDYLNLVCQFDDNVWANIMNEPMGKVETVQDEVDQGRMVKWFTLYMDGAIAKKRKSVLFNWGDRAPEIVNGMWHVRWHGLLRRAAVYPELFKIGMHFYGPDDMTLHLAAYVKTCEFLGITEPPEVIGTEFGIDQADTGNPMSGYRTRPGWYGRFYGNWMEQAINGPLASYIKSGVLVGLLVFTWSNHPDWKGFDVQEDTDWQNIMIDSKLVTKEIAIVRLNIPFPADFAKRSVERYIRSIGTSQWVRSQPNKNDKEYASVIMQSGQRCDIILEKDLKPEEVIKDTTLSSDGVWLPIQINSKQGWVFSKLVTLEEIKETSVTPPAQPEKTEPPLPFENGSTTPVVKTFTISTSFTGTEEDCKKYVEAMNLMFIRQWSFKPAGLNVEIPLPA